MICQGSFDMLMCECNSWQEQIACQNKIDEPIARKMMSGILLSTLPDIIDQQLLEHEQEKGNIHMSNIVRAWKDDAYSQSLSIEKLFQLPASKFELTDTEIETVHEAFDCTQDPTNKIGQDVDQKATAIYYNYDKRFPLALVKASSMLLDSMDLRAGSHQQKSKKMTFLQLIQYCYSTRLLRPRMSRSPQ